MEYKSLRKTVEKKKLCWSQLQELISVLQSKRLESSTSFLRISSFRNEKYDSDTKKKLRKKTGNKLKIRPPPQLAFPLGAYFVGMWR